MSFPQSLLSSTVLAGATFCVATVPLVALDSEAVTVQIDDEPVFVGQFSDVAVPYMGLAMAASLGIGAVHLSSLGWRQSSHKLSDVQDEVVRLRQQLQEQVSRVEAIQFSEGKLETAGLDAFLEPARLPASQPTPAARAANALTPSRHRDSLVANSSQSAGRTAQSAASSMPAAQTFHGFSASTQAARPRTSASALTITSHNAAQAEPLEDLMSQLKHVMAQVEKLQGQGINASAYIA